MSHDERISIESNRGGWHRCLRLPALLLMMMMMLSPRRPRVWGAHTQGKESGLGTVERRSKEIARAYDMFSPTVGLTDIRCSSFWGIGAHHVAIIISLPASHSVFQCTRLLNISHQFLHCAGSNAVGNNRAIYYEQRKLQLFQL